MSEGDGLPTEVHVYINEQPVLAARGATVLDAVAVYSSGNAMAVAAGRARVTDSRGLPIEPHTPVSGGMILRILPVRE